MRAVLLLALMLLTGCSGFNREWDRAGLEPRAGDGLTGRWEGTWISERNGHNGRLRCIVAAPTNGVHDARFRAKYWTILSFGYMVPLTGQVSNGVWQFEGAADLGKFAGGVYRYTGTVAGTNWNSTYRSKADHGHFRMNRVP